MITLSVNLFKERFNTTKIDIVRSPKTSKLFVTIDDGTKFKCQQSIDLSKPVAFIGETHEELCLVNPSTANVIGSL